MDGDPQGGRHAEPLERALSERVARLELELGTLRGEVQSLLEMVATLRDRPPAGSADQRAPGPPSLQSHLAAQGWVPNQLAMGSPMAAPAIGTEAAARRSQGSLESRFGSAILSKVAVVLLLLGAAWFLKWAFDNRWIGAAGRVVTGLAAGVSVILWSERFRRQQLPAFSYALKAVGSGVLYLSLWASVQLYHLAPAPAVFAAMACVTLWNGVMAWRQDTQLLAGYALLGAYLTPLLLRTRGDHEIFLFSYLLVLALVLLAWLRRKPWSPLLLGGLAATTALFIAWYVDFFEASKATATIAFAVALWAAFAVVPLFAAETGSLLAGVLTPLGTGVFGALTVYSVLADSGGRLWEPWWALGFAAAYLALARSKRVTAAVHLGLAIAFLSAAIPLKASGRTILLGWMVEGVALIAIAIRDEIDWRSRSVLRGLGCAVLLLAAGGALLQPWIFAGTDTSLFNADFGTSLAAVAALALTLVLSTRMRESGESFLPVARVAVAALVLLNVVLLVAMRRELNLWASAQSSTPTGLPAGMSSAAGTSGSVSVHANFLFSAWMMAQGAIMLAAGFWRRSALVRWTGLVLLAATVVKVFAFDMRDLGTGYRVVSYLGLGVLLMAVSFAYQKDWLGLLTPDSNGEATHRSSEAKV
jgi:uncharacterized membrane protein